MDDAETANALRTSGAPGTVFSKGPIGEWNVVVLPAPMELNGVIQAYYVPLALRNCNSDPDSTSRPLTRSIVEVEAANTDVAGVKSRLPGHIRLDNE